MKRLISLLVFIAVAIAVLWSTTSNYSEDDPLQQKQNATFVEVFMKDFEMTVMNEYGQPAYRLHGAHFERYNDSDENRIEQPVFHLLGADRQWLITADFALLNNNTNTVQLKNNVLMQQKNIEPATTIRTQSMLIHTKTQIAETLAPVDITQGKSQLTSNGMIYNNKTSELKLLSNVSGFYLSL